MVTDEDRGVNEFKLLFALVPVRYDTAVLETSSGLGVLAAPLGWAGLDHMAVGSQANVGGAASAPIVASAFHPSLAPVGVLLAVLGYALGTYAAWFCGQLMRLVAP